MQTAKYGHVEHANLLIRYGAGINAQNLVGNTALHVAASHGQVRRLFVAMEIISTVGDVCCV